MDRAIVLPWWRKKPAVIGGCMFAALLIGGGLVAGALASVKPTLRMRQLAVTIDTVQPGAFRDFTPLRATVAPRDVILLDLEEGGQVQQLFVHSGDGVARGQPLVRFSNSDLEEAILTRQSQIVDSIANLQSESKALEDSRAANERASADLDHDITHQSHEVDTRAPLLAKGFVSRTEYDQYKDQLDYDRDVLKPLQAETSRRQDALRATELPRIAGDLATLNESLKMTRAQLDNLLVRAPAAGRLTELTLSVGQIVGKGVTLAKLTADTGFILQAQVDEYYLGRVRPGQSARITLDGRDWPAKVARVDPQVKSGTFAVELDFDGAGPPGLLTGQTLEGRLTLGGDHTALILPAGPFLEVTGGDWAMVLDASGHHAEKRRIRIGARNAEQVEILGGLAAGERVITSDYKDFEKIEQIDLTN